MFINGSRLGIDIYFILKKLYLNLATFLIKAVGGNLKYRFPSDMGFPFAPTNRDRIFLIEYHYNNGLVEKGT